MLWDGRKNLLQVVFWRLNIWKLFWLHIYGPWRPFYFWIQGEKCYSKQLKKLPSIEVKRKLTGIFANLKLHYFTKRTQSKECKTQIETLLPGEVITHVDYSDNFKNKQKNEIKSAFYGQQQFTIYTACIYVNVDHDVKCKKYVLNKLENDYSCNVSFTLNDFLIKELQKVYLLSSSGLLDAPVSSEATKPFTW